MVAAGGTSLDLSRDTVAKVISMPVPRSEVGLVAALRHGQNGAIEALLERHGEPLYRVASRLLGPRSDPLPVVFESLRMAIDSLTLLRDPRALRIFLTSVLVARCMSRLRWRRVTRMLPCFGSGSGAWTGSKHHPAPSRLLEGTYRVLERLTVRERTVFVLRLLCEHELSEIAAILDLSTSQVRRAEARAEARFLALARTEPALHPWVLVAPTLAAS